MYILYMCIRIINMCCSYDSMEVVFSGGVRKFDVCSYPTNTCLIEAAIFGLDCLSLCSLVFVVCLPLTFCLVRWMHFTCEIVRVGSPE